MKALILLTLISFNAFAGSPDIEAYDREAHEKTPYYVNGYCLSADEDTLILSSDQEESQAAILLCQDLVEDRNMLIIQAGAQ